MKGTYFQCPNSQLRTRMSSGVKSLVPFTGSVMIIPGRRLCAPSSSLSPPLSPPLSAPLPLFAPLSPPFFLAPAAGPLIGLALTLLSIVGSVLEVVGGVVVEGASSFVLFVGVSVFVAMVLCCQSRRRASPPCVPRKF